MAIDSRERLGGAACQALFAGRPSTEPQLNLQMQDIAKEARTMLCNQAGEIAAAVLEVTRAYGGNGHHVTECRAKELLAGARRNGHGAR